MLKLKWICFVFVGFRRWWFIGIVSNIECSWNFDIESKFKSFLRDLSRRKYLETIRFERRLRKIWLRIEMEGITFHCKCILSIVLWLFFVFVKKDCWQNTFRLGVGLTLNRKPIAVNNFYSDTLFAAHRACLLYTSELPTICSV